MAGSNLGGLVVLVLVALCLCLALHPAQAASTQRYRDPSNSNRDAPDARKRQSSFDDLLFSELFLRSPGIPEALQADKRQQEESLVNNLAALLSGLKERQVEPNLRMPSLRFGK